MAEYKHLTCPVCDLEFDENSDVVVCPVCGTPHHRACYKDLGRCANIDWHDQNKTFDAELEKARVEGEKSRQESENTAAEENKDANSEEIVCRRCGHKNGAGSIFCSNCGLPISNGFGAAADGQAQRGFSVGFGPMQFTPPNPNEDFDGVEGWKMAAVVRENQFSFMPKFMALKNSKNKVSFNFFACLFFPYYFFYRKMYLWGILGMIFEFICGIPSSILMLTNQYLTNSFETTVTWGLNLSAEQMSTLVTLNYIASLVSLAVQILCGMFANYLYYKKCNKTAKRLDQKATSKEEFLQLAGKKGGTNRTIIIVFLAITVLASWAASLMLTNGMY